MKGDPARAEHELTLLKGGEALFPAMVEAIHSARSEVMLETYIFDFAHSALSVAEALERAAARGVTVRVVVDGVGTGEIPEDWRVRWAAAGVRWRIFNPAHGWRSSNPRPARPDGNCVVIPAPIRRPPSADSLRADRAASAPSPTASFETTRRSAGSSSSRWSPNPARSCSKAAMS